MSLDPLAAHLIETHGAIAVKVPVAAEIAGLDPDHVYGLIREGRFPGHGVARGGAKRESVMVLIPKLVEWMQCGGTFQYRSPRDEVAAPKQIRRRGSHQLAGAFAWLDEQLV